MASAGLNLLKTATDFLAGLDTPYAVIGSTMLLRFYPEVLVEAPSDLDLVMSENGLRAFVMHAESKGATVRCWGETVHPDRIAETKDKIYLRAELGDYEIDATYWLPDEAPGIADIIRRGQTVDNVHWAKLKDVCELMRIRGSEKDLRRLTLIRQTVSALDQ